MLKRLRPSPAMVVAMVALFVALGGTAWAVKKINGNTLANRTVSHLKIQRNTLTRSEINLRALGTVPRAALATRATTANEAAFSENAGRLDGQGPDFWQKACQDGTVKGYAIVNGDTNFPSVHTSEEGRVPRKFNCSGGAVEARRVDRGNYRVRLTGNTAVIAVANSYGPGSFDEYVSVNREATGEWEVVIHNSAGEATDHHFAIIVA